jgi:hypothetical protein
MPDETPGNKRAWEQPLRELTEVLYDAGPGSRSATHARGVIDARAALSSEAVAAWTKRLALATFALAIATVALAVVTAIKA